MDSGGAVAGARPETAPVSELKYRLLDVAEGAYLQACRRYQFAKTVFFAGVDAVLVSAAILASYALVLDGGMPAGMWASVPVLALTSVAVKLPIFGLQGLYKHSWSQVSFDDILRVLRGVTLASAALAPVIFILHARFAGLYIPRMLLPGDYILTLLAISAFRAMRRAQIHLQLAHFTGGTRALIVGAGVMGEHLVMSLRNSRTPPYVPVGFVDDSPAKFGAIIRGVRVVGACDELPALIAMYRADAVLIAMPSAQPETIRSIVVMARDAGVQEVRILPGLDGMLRRSVSPADLRDVELVDLLGRKPARIDFGLVDRWLAGRRVLVTGAAGSIGFELCRQLARFHVEEVVLLDIDETRLFWAAGEMRRMGLACTVRIEDVRHEVRMRHVLEQIRPSVVFHAAAYKHVDLMEQHPEQAVATNIAGTLSMLRASAAADVERFIFISTDKAVRPTSVMGVTKRVGELLALAFDDPRGMRCMAVRFGNVLGSRGSVVPIFQDHIRRGEPLTIRGENTRRYFMAVSEAVLLVLCAGAMGEGGDVFVLDMGEPIRIVDLACELVRLSGLRPHIDVPIVFDDLKPGEKEHEELMTAEEGTLATRQDAIMVARRNSQIPSDELLQYVNELSRLAETHDLAGAVHVLQRIVPTFEPSGALLTRMAEAARAAAPSAARFVRSGA
jgi:FlaA1/EpsC-like NDP-sugar epimerase